MKTSVVLAHDDIALSHATTTIRFVWIVAARVSPVATAFRVARSLGTSALEPNHGEGHQQINLMKEIGTMPKRLFLCLLTIAVAASVGVGAQQGVVSPEQAALDVQEINAAVTPAEVYGNANFQSGGTGMRNQKKGGITINGVTPVGVTPIIKANLYWAFIKATAVAPTLAERKININRQWPVTKVKPAGATLVGSVIGATASPCWGGSTLFVLKADATGVVTGNGFYRVQTFVGGVTTGGDPWNSPVVFPLQEGASLVVIYPQAGPFTAVYDGGLATMFSGALTYTLSLPAALSTLKIDFAGADGQYGAHRTPGFAGETTTINGIAVGGGSAWNDGLWNGKSGLPLPQLWDNDGRVLSIPATAALTITHTAGGDCLVPIANTVSNAGF